METVHPNKIVSFLINLFISAKKPLTFAYVQKVLNDSGVERLPDNFEVYNDNGQMYVKVITNLSNCELHCSSKTSCTGGSECTGLHICKFYLHKGSCRFGDSCKFGHDLTTPHNDRLVRENHLSGLGVEKIRYLLNLPENRTKTTIPEVCKYYNRADGCRQASTGNCPFLHVCRYYLQGSCHFGKKCSRSHVIDENVKKILKKHGIDTDKPVKELLDENEGDDDDKLDAQAAGPARRSSQPVLSKASSIESLSLAQEKRNPRGKRETAPSSKKLTRASSTADLGECVQSFSTPKDRINKPPPVPSSKKLTRAGSTADLANTGVIVCLYHLRGKCAFGKKCRNFHGTLPYQWQYRMGKEDPWEDVEHRGNQELELTYSQPKDSEPCLSLSNGQTMQINFFTMTGLVKGVGTFEVRRLSTVSSGEAKSEPLATDWIWYWIDDAEEWKQYGAGSNPRMQAYTSAVTSDDIEKVYLANPDGAMRFNTEGHEYLLDFNKMAQINIRIGTERPVRRRPVFVQDLVKMKGRLKGSSSEEKSATSGDVRVPVPPDWEVQGGRDITDHFKLTKITKRTNIREYSKVEQLFFETMPNTATITSIERVENGELWMYYCFKKERMQKKSDGKVDERQLFHGTNPEYVDAICQQNFDFRLSGLSYGTRYGKGSYFAVEAKYSDSYTDHSNRVMFLVKVLVGQYKKGQSKFVRPPSKDESNKASDLYDACVDDENNPTIFVIFDRCQMYPEFLIKYEIKAPKLF